MQCPNCNYENRPDRRFCTECGARLSVACPACGAPTEAGEKFCGVCGAQLVGTRQTAVGSSDPPLTTNNLTTNNLPEGERRHLTVLFCDLVGSTEIASQLDPEEWSDIAARYQRTAAEAVQRFGGHVAKYLGDGLVVYFGYPQAHDDDPERAVRAGLAIVDAVRALPLAPSLVRKENSESSPLPRGTTGGSSPDTQHATTRLHVRVGMHTGSVVISQGGGTDVEIFGDTPNIAARVQSIAQADAVFITGSTQRLVAGIFVVEELGAHTLKGVPEPVPLYRVLQPSGVRSRLDVAGHRFTPFVGRDLELGVLLDRWERVEERDGQSVVISGEAGVGKSRLMHTLRERLTDAPHTWLECRCTPFTEHSAFRPVIELVEQGLTFTTADAPADKIRKLEVGLGRAGFGLAETVPLFADFLSVPLAGGYVPLPVNPDVQRKKTVEALVRWTLALGGLQPVLLLVEDLHWCDPSSLELFGRLIEQSRTTRLMMLCTARPEFQPPWPARTHLTLMQLNRLTKRQSRQMVAALSPERALPAAVVEAVVTRADGIPLYLEELARMVLDSGMLQEREGRYELSGSLDDLAIPATLQDSLMARLDRLSAAKDVAQRAAVLGREFAYELLAAIAGIEEPALRQGLGQLVEAELLFQRGEPPEATYTFKHALVQEAAYESLLKRTRQQLHGRVVDVLAGQFPERAESEPELVARHAEAAGRIDDAIRYYDRAGDQAQARSAHAEAIGQLRKAIALQGTRPAGAERDARELSLQLALGGSLIAARGYAHPETAAAYERAAALGAAVGDAARLGVAHAALAICYYNRAEVERGRALAADVLAAAEARGDCDQAFLGHSSVAFQEHFQGRFASSLAHCERAIALYDPVHHHAHVRVLGNDQGVAQQGFAAWNLWFVGAPDTALARVREAVALARRLAHPFTLAFALFFEAHLHVLRQDIAAQRERAAELIALSEAQSFPLWLGLGRVYHAAARVTQGDPSALAEIMEGLALVAETGTQLGAPGIFAVLAEAQRAAGQFAEAQSTVATALAIAAQTGQPFFDADLYRLRAEIVLDQARQVAPGFPRPLGEGQGEGSVATRVNRSPHPSPLPEGEGAEAEAEACFHRALAIAREQGARSFELRAATSLARLWRDQGQRREARDLLAPIYAWFTEGFDTRDLQDAKALLDNLA
jgi:class 3 adenylate cyclase/predicted ATPase